VSTAKRSGARDISDLKARLGLKKKSAPETASANGGIPAPPGVVPPPSSKITGSVPIPPGVAPPRPAAPFIPDASEDPFGAMNAMAAHQAAVAAPEPIVIVNDGRPVESVDQRSPAIRFAIIGGMILVPLVIGLIMGQIGNKNAAHNHSVEDAKKLRTDIEVVGKRLIGLQQTLQVAKERGQKGGKPWYQLNDEKLTKELKAAEALAPNQDLLLKARLHQFPEQISDQLHLFYAETALLQKQIKEHIKLSDSDSKVIKEGAARLGNFNPRAYAGLLLTPTAEEAQSGMPVRFKLVQLGMPICAANSKPTPEGCGASVPWGFQYRLSETGEFGTKKIAGSEVDGSLIFFDPDTPFFLGIVKGGGSSVAEADYMKRIESIDEKIEALVGARKFLMQVLNNKSNQGTKFTFFVGG
jgi:hypothetical protein